MNKRDLLWASFLSEMSINFDDYLTHGGAVHAPKLCEGEVCVVHHPSDHHMVSWPRIMRMQGLIERQCPHGIGHPDPDSLAYYLTIGEDYSVHGCDSCCRDPLTGGV